jgi:hypothetical protein
MYKNIVDQMKCYEKLKLTDWIDKAKLLSIHQMNNNILVCVRKNDGIGKYKLSFNVKFFFFFIT